MNGDRADVREWEYLRRLAEVERRLDAEIRRREELERAMRAAAQRLSILGGRS